MVDVNVNVCDDNTSDNSDTSYESTVSQINDVMVYIFSMKNLIVVKYITHIII